jgi:hypothetical protein
MLVFIEKRLIYSQSDFRLAGQNGHVSAGVHAA